ncbi:MAG: hypothetical protein ACLP7P_13130 [Rhodomicrobium sp.]
MTKVKMIEFWLVALPVLFVLAGWAAGFEQEAVAKYLLPLFAAVWMLLAIVWMFREIVRKIRD